jgi:hypothetical protein
LSIPAYALIALGESIVFRGGVGQSHSSIICPVVDGATSRGYWTSFVGCETQLSMSLLGVNVN